jgi:hypothetical protein
MPPTTHSTLGASSASRWLNCPGSVSLSEGMPNPSSKYALEGTAAHQLAEECILNKRSPYTYINGGTVTLEDDDGNQIEYEVTSDMAEAVMVYLKEVTALANYLGQDITGENVEVGFHLDWIDEELWGTNDLMLGVPFDTLYIYDYKHGQGVAVDVENNVQLMYYALGALGPDNPNCYTDVVLCIVQPRATHPDGPIRKWRVSVDALYDFHVKLLEGVKATRDKNAPLCSGPHCRWCLALSVCPEVGKEAASVAGLTAKQVFGDKPLTFPGPNEILPEQRVKLYQFIEQFEQWAKAIKSDTHDKLLSGHDFPGLKVVAGRASRKYRDEAEAEKKLVGLIGEDAYTSSLKSVAQAEKELKKHGLGPEAISDLIETTRGNTVALESDKRPALTIKTASEAFA